MCRIANILWAVKAVHLLSDELSDSVNRKAAPMYCDIRMVLSNPVYRKIVEENLAQLISDNYPNCDMIIGTATGGIAHAAIVAHLLNLPMGYVRESPKKHGLRKTIEGQDVSGQKVVIVEDLIACGNCIVKTANILREAGAQIMGVVSIYTYNYAIAHDRLIKAGIVHHSLTCFEELIKEGIRENHITQNIASMLIEYSNVLNDRR